MPKIGYTKQFLLLYWQSLWACWVSWLSPALWLCLFRILWTPSIGNQARILLAPAPLLPWNKLMFVYWRSRISSYCFFPVHSSLLPHTKQNQYTDVLKCSYFSVQFSFCFRRGDGGTLQWKQHLVHDMRSRTWYLFLRDLIILHFIMIWWIFPLWLQLPFLNLFYWRLLQLDNIHIAPWNLHPLYHGSAY